MRSLGQPNAAYAGDRGDADPETRTALRHVSQFGAGEPNVYLQAVAALCASRLLLPIVASGDDSGASPDPNRPAEMAAVLLTSVSGETGVLAFTGLDALTAWNPAARPVPCTLDDVAATALETGSSAVVVDVAGPHPLIIEQPLVGELAAGRRLVRLSDGGWGWLSRQIDSSESRPTS